MQRNGGVQEDARNDSGQRQNAPRCKICCQPGGLLRCPQRKDPAAATFEMPTAERLASDLVQFGHPVAAVASGRRRRASLAEKVLSKQSLGLAHCVCFGHSQCLV